MKQLFTPYNPNLIAGMVIDRVNGVIDHYRDQGLSLTLRQLYYQMVAQKLIPNEWADPQTGSVNNVKSYKKLMNIVSRGRLGGMIDWGAIEDRGRSQITNGHWDSPEELIDTAANAFYKDHWADSNYKIIVMAEKDAVSNVVTPVCRRRDVAFIANKGYASQTMLYNLGSELREGLDQGKEIVLIYLGDHDPSGLDMDRDLEDRLNLFAEVEDLIIERIALTKPQINEMDVPPDPAKPTDPRSEKYRNIHGEYSWELDAIPPQKLAEIVDAAIEGYVDDELWNSVEDQILEVRAKIRKFANTWS